MIEVRHPGLARIATLPALRLTSREFAELPEYSATLPTGTTIGKRWKRHDGIFDHEARRRGLKTVWMIGEYAEHPDPKTVRIIWYRPIIGVRAA